MGLSSRSQIWCHETLQLIQNISSASGALVEFVHQADGWVTEGSFHPAKRTILGQQIGGTGLEDGFFGLGDG